MDRVFAALRRVPPRQALVVALALVLGLAAGATPWGASVERYISDVYHLLAGVRERPTDALIVKVDDATCALLKDEPQVFWNRHFAKAINTLRAAGALSIGIDYIWMVSLENWLAKIGVDGGQAARDFDRPLRLALSGGGVVLAAQFIDATNRRDINRPCDEYVFSLPGQFADLAFVNVHADPDGAVRSWIPVVGEKGNPPWLSFGALLALKARGLDPDGEWKIGARTVPASREPALIRYLGPPGTFPRLSFARLLAPDAAADPLLKAAKGRVVIIAAEETGTQDIHGTPYYTSFLGLGGQHMVGSEIQANIVSGMLSGKGATSAGWPLAGLLLLAAAWLVWRRAADASALRGGLAAAALGAAVLLAGFLLFLLDARLAVVPFLAFLLFAWLGFVGLRLSREEREKAHAREVFGRYVPAHVVDELMQSGRAPRLGGESIRMSVLFSDIRNFTSISERLRPTEVVELVNRWFEAIGGPIAAHGGTIDKYIGDAVMVLFGTPVGQPDHARRALATALALAETAAGFQGWVRERFGKRYRGLPVFRVGVGVHTGEAVVGNVGSSRHMGFTAIGDVVNAASRLEGLNKELGTVVLASQETLREAGKGVLTGLKKSVRVKGKRKALVVHEILAVADPRGKA